MVSRASSGGISASSTPTASSPQDDTVDGDDISLASSHIPSLAPDSPVARPHTTIEIQVFRDHEHNMYLKNWIRLSDKIYFVTGCRPS